MRPRRPDSYWEHLKLVPVKWPFCTLCEYFMKENTSVKRQVSAHGGIIISFFSNMYPDWHQTSPDILQNVKDKENIKHTVTTKVLFWQLVNYFVPFIKLS